MGIIDLLLVIGAALGVLIIALWVIREDSGRISMFKPSLIFLSYSFNSNGARLCRVRLFAALHCESKRGCTIQNQELWLYRDNEPMRFSQWSYLDKGRDWMSGDLFVPSEGLHVEERFTTCEGDSSTKFMPGAYELVIIGRVEGGPKERLLDGICFDVNDFQASELNKSSLGLCLRRDVEKDSYHPTIKSFELKTDVRTLTQADTSKYI